MAYKRLGELLVAAGTITEEELERGLALQKGTKERLGTVLIKNEIITESREVSLGPEHFGSEECRYHHINLIITAKEMNDEKTVIKLIENYQFNDYAIKRLFEPIGG